MGLAAYQVGDADRFFGREALTDTLQSLADGSGIILGRRDGNEYTVERWTLVVTLLRAPYRMCPSAGRAGLIVTTSDSGNLAVLNTDDPHAPRIVARAGGPDHPAVTAFDPAGRSVAVVHPGRVRLWDTASGATLLNLHTQGRPLHSPHVDCRSLVVLDEKNTRPGP